VERARLGKVDLISRDRKLAPDCAPCLHVDFWSVERRFIRHFNKVDPGILQDAARHFFGLPPKLGFIDKFLSELRGIVRRETHQIFLNPEKFEIIQIHLVCRLLLEKKKTANYSVKSCTQS